MIVLRILIETVLFVGVHGSFLHSDLDSDFAVKSKTPSLISDIISDSGLKEIGFTNVIMFRLGSFEKSKGKVEAIIRCNNINCRKSGSSDDAIVDTEIILYENLQSIVYRHCLRFEITCEYSIGKIYNNPSNIFFMAANGFERTFDCDSVMLLG